MKTSHLMNMIYLSSFFCKLVPIRYTPLIKQNDVVVVVVVVVREAKDDKKKSYEISIDE
jgi:hypothetical protein